MQQRTSRNELIMSLVGGLAALGAYSAMYAFRKPFAAGMFEEAGALPFGLDYKSGLLIAQVIGYAFSKLIGIKIIAEFGRHGRATAILTLIGLAWLALLLFALLPPSWGILCMLLNGLPLGMIWGLVFSYVEGRRTSELLAAILCASIILASGIVKSVAVMLMQQGVSSFWMPATTGAAFLPLLLVSLWVLERLPPPNAQDEAERTKRLPMGKVDRARFLRDNAAPMTMLIAGYVLLTAFRDLRDNFSAELWAAMGFEGVASIFSASELPVAAIALAGLGALMLIRDNMRALLAMHGFVILGAAMLGLSTLAFQSGLLGPLPWMILTGAGLYLGYTPFNAMLFDRMIAALGQPGNAGFLIYVADASGYVGSVGLLLYRSFGAPRMDWLPFFINCAYTTAVLVAILTTISALYFAQYNRGKATFAHA